MALHRFHNTPGAYTFGGQGGPLWGIGSLIQTETERRRLNQDNQPDDRSHLEMYPEGPPNRNLGSRGPNSGVRIGPGGVSYGGGYQSGPSIGGGYGGSTYGGYGGGRPSPFTTSSVGGGVPMPGLPTGDGGGGGGAFGGIGRFITKNPELVASLAGTAADVYGAGKERKQREKEFEIEQENERKRQEMDRVRMILQAMSAGI